MIANRKEPGDGAAKVVRTMVTLDNGGEWNYVSPPETDLSGAPILCEPPSCSLHFHMASSEYARLGIYSQVHGTCFRCKALTALFDARSSHTNAT